LVVMLDGRRVFSLAENFYPVPSETISFGLSFIDGSTADPEFTGAILEFGPAPDSALTSLVAEDGRRADESKKISQ
jgi:hypothetical protein